MPFATSLSVLLLMLLTAAAGAREWRDRQGRSYEGEFSGLVNGVVELVHNGRVIKIQFEDLSDVDQDFVNQRMAELAGNAGDGGGQPGADPGGGDGAGPAVEAGGGAGSTMPNLAPRTWRDTAGRTLTGRFGGLLDRNTVRIFSATGEPRDVALSNLSPADQEYVQTVVELFDPRVHGRTWTQIDNTTHQGTFIQIKNTEIWILTSFDDDRLELEAALFTQPDLDFVCEELDGRVVEPPAVDGARFRVWTASDGSWRVIGRLFGRQEDRVVLEQEDENIWISIRNLSATDQSYVRSMFPDESPYGDDELKGKDFEDEPENKRHDDGFDWSRYYDIHPIVVVIFVVSVLGLVGAIAFKYIAESFSPDD